MEGDPRIDEFMRPVLAAIDRHVKGNNAKTDIYNRAYEALMEAMDMLDTSAAVTAKQIAENAKNLQRAEAAEAENKRLREALGHIADGDEYTSWKIPVAIAHEVLERGDE